jgi:hypothetical protein
VVVFFAAVFFTERDVAAFADDFGFDALTFFGAFVADLTAFAVFTVFVAFFVFATFAFAVTTPFLAEFLGFADAFTDVFACALVAVFAIASGAPASMTLAASRPQATSFPTLEFPMFILFGFTCLAKRKNLLLEKVTPNNSS